MLDDIKIGKYIIPRNCVTLGKGSFANVLLGHEDSDYKKKAAIKVIPKSKLHSHIWGKELEILEILSRLNQVNLVNFLHFEESRDHIFLVTEFCNGGDLEKYLNNAKVIPELSIAHLLRHIASGLESLKSLNIVHRDLKPANILMSFTGSRPRSFLDIVFKIADFGFAKFLAENMMTATVCGSPVYMAPEIYKYKSYNYKADLWSVGVITYQCAIGKVPFSERSYEKLGRVYKDGRANLELPDHLGSELQHLIKGLLVQEAEQRLMFEEFFAHPFLTLHSESSTCFRRSSESDVPREMADRASSGKENTKVNSRREIRSRDVVRRMSIAGESVTASSLVSDFVIVEHHMTPERELCNVSYGTLTNLALCPPPRRMSFAKKVLVTRDTQTPTREIDVAMETSFVDSGCSVDRKDRSRRDSVKTSEGIKNGWTCMSLDEVDTPSIPINFVNKKMTTNMSQSPTSNAATWSCSSESMHQLMLGADLSLSSVFGDLEEQFTSPELDEKLLMEEQQVEILEKLEYLLKLVHFTRKLADHSGLWVKLPPTSSASIVIAAPPLSDEVKLSLYARCLLIILSAIESARNAVKSSDIYLSKTLRKIVSKFKNSYDKCLTRSREVRTHFLKEQGFEFRTASKAAETTLYHYALEAARNGARAESMKLFNECFQYYHIAYVFLHWVEIKAISDSTRASIRGYKVKIEKRLKHFQETGTVPFLRQTK